ncbi:MAG: hypothetical protein WAL30_00730 [Candidatus Aquirickettsiella sp.]
MSNNLELESQIQATHIASIGKIKDTLLTKADQQVDFSNDKLLNDQIFEALNAAGKEKFEICRLKAREQVLEAYKHIIEGMAEKHLKAFQSEELVSRAQKKLQEKLELIKRPLFEDLKDNISADKEIELEQTLNQSLDKINKQLGASLVGFGPAAINTYKAKLALHNEQLKNKKTDAHLTAKVFNPDTFTPDPMAPVGYGYKIDIDKLRSHIKHKLAHLKPGEKLHIDVEIPPDRADILKRIAENGFQYRISFVALLLLLLIELKMINKDDETRTVSAIKELINKDHIPLHAEDITFSIKARGNDGKMQTVLESRPVDPAVAAWKLNEPLQALRNILYPPMGSNKKRDEPEENTFQSNYQQELRTDNTRQPFLAR